MSLEQWAGVVMLGFTLAILAWNHWKNPPEE